jgi:hypothetical protein
MDNIEAITLHVDAILEFIGVTSQASPLKEIEKEAKALYDHYHKRLGKNKTDFELVKKYYRLLSKSEREQALLSIEKWAYMNRNDDPKYIKKCWKYLRDKNFNDEMTSPNELHFR